MKILKIEDLAVSQLLRDYVNKITSETGREILILSKENDFGYPALFYPSSDTYITVHITHHAQEDINRFEPILAHEITHGYLKYKCNYGFIESMPQYMMLASRIQTMIEDIPVQKIIGDYGFRVLPETYENNIFSQINALKVGMPPSAIYEQSLQPWNVIHDIILYWGHIKYVPISNRQQDIFVEGLEVLSKIFNEQYLIATQIMELICENNIFTEEGYQNIIKTIISKWHLPFKYLSK